MANPFGYGSDLGFSRGGLGQSGLFPIQWAQDALRLSLPSVYFPQITPMRTDFQAMEGQAIVVPLEGEMVDSTWPTLTEGTSITVGSYNLDSFTVTIKEAGRGVAMERLVRQYLVNGLYPGAAQNYVRKLTNNFALSWENSLRTLYLSGRFRIRSVAQGSFTDIENGDTSSATTVTGTLTSDAISHAVAQMREVRTGSLGTFIVQPFDDGLYRFVGNWSTLRSLTQEDDFLALQTRNQGLGGRGLIYQEIGPWNGCMFVRHDLMPDGTCLIMGRNVAVQAFGGRFEDEDIPAENILRLEEPVPFQIRIERDWKADFYRAKAAAWYVLAGSSAALRDIGTACVRFHCKAK